MKNIAFLRIVALVLCFTFSSGLNVSIIAQSFCSAGNTPGSLGVEGTWAQNSIVSVNVSNGFTRAEYDNCIVPVINSFNLTNGATGAGYGNYSGVYFSVTYLTNVTATINPATGASRNADGVSNGLQINRGNLGLTQGTTSYGGNQVGTNRTSAVMSLNSQMNNCQAIQETFAHELSHTMGLNHCGETLATNCTSGSSVMRRTVCTETMTNSECVNSYGQGRTSPSQCDNQRIQQTGEVV